MGEASSDMQKLSVEMVSKEKISPSSPTPDHLKIQKLSVLDQTEVKVYVPLILFYGNTHNTSNIVSSVINEDRSKLLKQSLSDTLTRFYPLAGKVKDDDLHIDCNDEGVYYIETRVNSSLSDFLSQPLEDALIKKLLVPNEALESPRGNYVLIIQVNIFSCGGIALCTCLNHMFVDGNTYTLFLKDWTAATRGCSSELVKPSYIAPMLFPQIASVPFDNPCIISDNMVSQRFVFDGINIAALKDKTKLSSSGSEPTRTEVVGALLWKCLAKAACKVDESAIGKPFNLGLITNLRGKNCVPKTSVGNLIWPGLAQCVLAPELEYKQLVDRIKECKAETNDDFVEAIKGDNGTQTLLAIGQLMMAKEISFSIWISSMCNMGIYELDFGWGKPSWFYYCSSTMSNFISLCDTPGASGGVEAVVSLSQQHMCIVENDPEILAFASLNPSPL